MAANNLQVEVVYITPQHECKITLLLEESMSIHSAIARSGIQILFPEIDLTQQKIGIFSQPRQLSDRIQTGDRIEIYRPLTKDPKELRRKKALNQ